MTDSVPPTPPVPSSAWPNPPDGDPDPTRTGPAWEQPGGSWFTRFAQTTQALLMGPSDFFRTMRREGGLGEPVGYGVIGSVAGGFVGAIYQLLLSTAVAGLQGPVAAREQAVAGLFSTGCIIVIMPIASVVGMFVGSAIYHVMLLLLGGARRPYETTLRVSAYSSGGTAVLNLIPLCGSIIAGVYAIVVAIVGLARAHEISTGKAAAAVLLPVLVCCGLLALLYGALAALLVGAIMSGASQ